jgi:hypothetical protein
MATPTQAYTDHHFDVSHPGIEIEDTEVSENDWSDGVHTIYGIREEPGPNGGRTTVSGFRFDAGEFTLEEARDWLEDQDYGGAELVEEGGQLGRENPSESGNYTTLITVGVSSFIAGMIVNQ